MLTYSQKFNVFDNNIASKPINLLVGGTFNAMNYKDQYEDIQAFVIDQTKDSIGAVAI